MNEGQLIAAFFYVLEKLVQKTGVDISCLLRRCLFGRALLGHLLELALVADETRDWGKS